jgi:hypothetical protein
MERKEEAGLVGDWFDQVHIRLGFDGVLGAKKG